MDSIRSNVFGTFSRGSYTVNAKNPDTMPSAPLLDGLQSDTESQSTNPAPTKRKLQLPWILFIFALLVLLLLGVCIMVAYVALKDDFPEACQMNATDDEIASFKLYEHKFDKDYYNETYRCQGFVNYLNTVQELRQRNNASFPTVYGLTAFSDGDCAKRREDGRMESQDVVKDPRMYDWIVKVPRANVTYAPFAHSIRFDDSCSLKLNMEHGLRHLKSGYSKKQYNTPACVPSTGNKLELVQRVHGGINETIMADFVHLNGPFAFMFITNMRFFDYTSGIFSMAECKSDTDEFTSNYVLVIGYGTENGTDYWEIMPVGEKWRQWGQDGIGKIERGGCLTAHQDNSPKIYALLE